jgi:hypothetical protein
MMESERRLILQKCLRRANEAIASSESDGVTSLRNAGRICRRQAAYRNRRHGIKSQASPRLLYGMVRKPPHVMCRETTGRDSMTLTLLFRHPAVPII